MSRYNHDHDVPFEGYVTNLGKYNEGELVGEWVKFPTDSDHIQDVFDRIGIGQTDEFGQPYEEWFISDYDVYVDGIYNILGEYENLDELNFLASRIEELSDYEYSKFEAILEEGSYASSVEDLINLTSNLDAFEVMPDVENNYDLGYYYIEEAGIHDLNKMGELAGYIDYEKYGKDLAIREGATFTQKGCVIAGRDSFVIVYDGNPRNIPEEYRLDTSINYHRSNKVNHLEKNIANVEKAYGYVYDSNGMHGERIEFEGTPSNMANFIMHNKDHPVVITTETDQFIVSSTQGGFLDRVYSPELRDQILTEILPLQMGDKDPVDVTQKEFSPNVTEASYAVRNGQGEFTQIDLQIRSSDLDFEYNLSRDGRDIDGGIIANELGIETLDTSSSLQVEKEVNRILDDIKQDYNLEGEIGSIDMWQHNQSVERMEYLGLPQDIVERYDNLEEITVSHKDGTFTPATSDQLEHIKEIANNYGGKVYHIIEGDYRMSDGDILHMDNYLYTSREIDEWSYDREGMEQGLIVADVNNTSWGLNEIGTIGICPSDNGTLVRNDIGYDFNELNQQSFTIDDLPFDDKSEMDVSHDIEI